MKVTVTKYLNVRAGKPGVNAPCYLYLAPGSEVEVDGTLYKGDLYEGIDTWMKDEAGNYYWSGGLDAPVRQGPYPWWLENSLFSIPGIWAAPGNQAVKVAILDTGISKHVDFDFTNVTGHNYLNDSDRYQEDAFGHGTHCAGIVAAKGSRSYGIAPASALFVAKVCDDFGRPVIAAVRKALDDIFEGRNGGNDVRIINMSFNVVPQSAEEDRLLSEIETMIARLASEKKCIIICSGGETDDLDDSFPAKMKECIAVGSISSKLVRSTFSRITPVLDIMAPGEAITSSDKTDSIAVLSGTSQSAAFVSGVAALALQKMNAPAATPEMIKDTLYKTAFSNSFLSQEYGHGIIHPNRFIESLNNH